MIDKYDEMASELMEASRGVDFSENPGWMVERIPELLRTTAEASAKEMRENCAKEIQTVAEHSSQEGEPYRQGYFDGWNDSAIDAQQTILNLPLPSSVLDAVASRVRLERDGEWAVALGQAVEHLDLGVGLCNDKLDEGLKKLVGEIVQKARLEEAELWKKHGGPMEWKLKRLKELRSTPQDGKGTGA